MDSKQVKPGEKGFAFFILLLGLGMGYKSIGLYQNNPGASSPGAMPLFISGLLIVFSTILLIQNWKAVGENSRKSLHEQMVNTIKHLGNIDVFVMVLLLTSYGAALYLNVGFIIATPFFLWVAMSYLARGGYVKNILWTAILMIFIMLVFRVLFSIVLP